jgi:hypothetical protein
MRIKQNDAVDRLAKLGKVWFPNSNSYVAITVPILIASVDQVELTINDLLVLEWRCVSVSPITPSASMCFGVCTIFGTSPPSITQSTVNQGTYALLWGQINGSNDLELTIVGGDAGNPTDAQGYFEITHAELFSLQ